MRSNTAPLITHFLTDALGSTIGLTKADQTVQAAYRYEPYGKTMQSTPEGQVPSDNPYQYTGRENEAASAMGNQAAEPLASLYHYRHRFYSTGLARFISEDPIEFDGGANLYAYVEGDPVGNTDPLGLWGGPPTKGTYYGNGQIPTPPKPSINGGVKDALEKPGDMPSTPSATPGPVDLLQGNESGIHVPWSMPPLRSVCLVCVPSNPFPSTPYQCPRDSPALPGPEARSPNSSRACQCIKWGVTYQ